MDSFYTQALNALNDDEMSRLVSVVVEEFGPALARTQFNDTMLALFENIAGLETLTHKRQQHYLKLLWLKYQQALLAIQSRH